MGEKIYSPKGDGSPYKRSLQVLHLLHDWRKEGGKDYINTTDWWDRFTQKHKKILNYTKVSRLVTNNITNKEVVKAVINRLVDELFPEEGNAPDLHEIDYSTLKGVAKLIQFVTGLTFSKYPKFFKHCYTRRNWSIALLLLLLSRLTKKRGTAIKLIRDLVKGYKNSLRITVPR